MKKKIAVYGSAKCDNPETLAKAREAGREIARNGFVLLCGGTTGVTKAAAEGAKEEQGLVIGISPAMNREEHTEKFGLPLEPYDVLIYTGFAAKGRNVVLVRSADAGIVISGGAGTLGEFANSLDDSKVVGVLEGTGGIADAASTILRACGGQGAVKVIYSSEPKELVRQVLEGLR